MKVDLKTIRDTVEFSYEAFRDARVEEKEIRDFYHNRQYNDDQLETLTRRQQPAETFNIIKIFARLLVGYYSTIVNTVQVLPRQVNDIGTAAILNDIIQYTFEQNQFETEGDKVKLEGILSGLMCVYIDVINTGQTDQFGRPIRRIELMNVPSREIILDPLSRAEDYSDARFIHRFRWISEDELKKFLRATKKSKKEIERIMNELEEYDNHLEKDDSEFTHYFPQQFSGYYNNEYDNYLLVHTVIEDDNGQVWSVFWIDEIELVRKKITYREVKFPYRIQRTHSSDKSEYYGFFREIVESQKTINQAILKIQLMANSQKILIEKGAVADLDKFTDSYNRVNAICEVTSLAKIRVENLTPKVGEQYVLIDKAYDRIQKTLGINDSFLGRAFASDSGRKVKIQQDATLLALRYLSTKIEQLYRSIGLDIANLIKQYYTANEVLSLTDEITGQRWFEINKPLTTFQGNYDEQGQILLEPVLSIVLDPENREPLLTENGAVILAPIARQETEIAFTNFDIKIDSKAYNDEAEKNQLLLETFLQGPVGQTIAALSPGDYLKIASLIMKNNKTRYSGEITEILNRLSAQILQSPPPNPQQQADGLPRGAGLPNNKSQNSPSPRSDDKQIPTSYAN